MKIKNVINLPVAVTDYTRAVDWILEKASLADRPYAVDPANTHVAALARHDPDFRETMSKFDLITPDGMPLVWSINAQLPPEEKLTDRVYGPNLMLRTFSASNTPDSAYRHFLLGGKPETLKKLTERFSKEFPHTVITDTYSPPFGEWPELEIESIIEKIRASRANLIWVGLGCPKQETWIAKNKHRLPPGVYFAIGAAFAFHAGEVKQAPPILQKLGLEWFYRLIREPRRLFRRYFTYNSLFLYYSLKERHKTSRHKTQDWS